MSVITYIRVSTKDQFEERQFEKLIEKYKVEKIYHEKISGKNADRPQLKAMLDYVREGDTLVIESYSRLGRDTKDLLNIVDMLDKKGVTLISDKENMNTSTASGKFMLTVFAALAQFERECMLERQAEGIAVMPTDENGKKISMRTGRAMGRPTTEIPENFEAVYDEWKSGKITAVQAFTTLNLTKATFYRIVKQYENR